MASNYANSIVASGTYTILPPAALPAFSLKAGPYAGVQSVAITDRTPSSKIYYTTNGKAPTVSSTVYTGIIKVAATQTIKAIALAPGYSQSDVASVTYTITPAKTGAVIETTATR